MGSRPAALIFDLDNTLVHSRIDFVGLRGAVVRELVAAGLAEASSEAWSRLALGELVTLGARRVPALGARLWSLVEEHERAGMLAATVEEDVGPTLAALRARGHPLAVLTNNARKGTLAALERFELAAWFDLVVTRDDVPALKPDGAGVAAVRRRLADGRRPVLVGDSWIDGVAAARGGASFVAFRSRLDELEARGVAPWRNVSRLSELLALPL